jgi:hypothetical protein
VIEEWFNLRDPLEKGPVRSSPYALKNTDLVRPVVALLMQDFINVGSFNLSTHVDKAVFAYTKEN